MPFFYNVGGRIVEIEIKGRISRRVPATLFGFPVVVQKRKKHRSNGRKVSVARQRLALEKY